MSAKERLKGKLTKDSVTLLPCFYFVEVGEFVYRLVTELCTTKQLSVGVRVRRC